METYATPAPLVEMRNISQLGGTNNDEHDMRMLGRTQVLNVRELTKMGVMRVAY